MLYYVLGFPQALWGQGGARGVSWGASRGEGEQAGSKESELGARGASWG